MRGLSGFLRVAGLDPAAYTRAMIDRRHDADAAGFRVEVFRGLPGLDALAADWRALFRTLERPSYVHLWEWHRSYLEALAPAPDAVCFCALYDGGAPVAILPLVEQEERFLGMTARGVALPTHPHVPHADILVDPRMEKRLDLDRVLETVRARLGFRWDVCRLGPTLEDSIASAAVRALDARPETRGALVVTELERHSDALDVTSYPALLNRLSKNFRGSLRKARNKLAQLEGMEVRWGRTPAEIYPAFERFLEVEASGWKGEGGIGTAIQLDPSLRAFYGGLMQRLAQTGRARINLLMHGDRVMAGQLGVVSGDRYYLLKIGYDESYKREAPGNMLLERLLEAAGDEPGVRYVDLVTDTSWHESWKPVRRQVLTHLVFHPSWYGVTAWAGLRGKQVLRPVVRRLRRHARELATRLDAARSRRT